MLGLDLGSQLVQDQAALEEPLASVYEAIRRRALEELESQDDGAVRILAAITRLRLACCHPGLVLPELSESLRSAKLFALEKLLEGLRQGGHRALVFSQFVRVLERVRKRLDAQGVPYRMLTGRTPPRERQKSIEAFQAGHGDVFLITLKAGGTGLNLTAADYVIHLDPWWNPAVEDQASSRAHRLGQSQPVTVYRLVTRGTIEESILALHERKRELAESLLSGAKQAVGCPRRSCWP